MTKDCLTCANWKPKEKKLTLHRCEDCANQYKFDYCESCDSCDREIGSPKTHFIQRTCGNCRHREITTKCKLIGKYVGTRLRPSDLGDDSKTRCSWTPIIQPEKWDYNEKYNFRVNRKVYAFSECMQKINSCSDSQEPERLLVPVRWTDYGFLELPNGTMIADLEPSTTGETTAYVITNSKARKFRKLGPYATFAQAQAAAEKALNIKKCA